MPKKKDSPGKLIDDRFNTLENKIDNLGIQLDRRLNRVEFEMIDIKITQGQMLSTLKEILEQQKTMVTQVVNLVTEDKLETIP